MRAVKEEEQSVLVSVTLMKGITVETLCKDSSLLRTVSNDPTKFSYIFF